MTGCQLPTKKPKENPRRVGPQEDILKTKVEPTTKSYIMVGYGVKRN